MPRRCPYCGTENRLSAENCSKCQNSLEHISQEEHKSLKDLRVFSIVFLITSLISTGEFAYNVASTSILGNPYGFGLTSIFTTIATPFSTTGLTTFFLIVEIFFVVILFVYCVSFIYLRASFSKLRKFDFSFSTPTTGTTLLIIGIILALIGFGLILAYIFPLLNSLSGTTPANPTAIPTAALGFVILGGFGAGIGALLLLIGYIIGVLLGLHRLALKFEDSYFDYGLVLIIVSLFFSPIGLIAAVLIFLGVKRSKQRLDNAKIEEMMAPP